MLHWNDISWHNTIFWLVIATILEDMNFIGSTAAWCGRSDSFFLGKIGFYVLKNISTAFLACSEDFAKRSFLVCFSVAICASQTLLPWLSSALPISGSSLKIAFLQWAYACSHFCPSEISIWSLSVPMISSLSFIESYCKHRLSCRFIDLQTFSNTLIDRGSQFSGASFIDLISQRLTIFEIF